MGKIRLLDTKTINKIAAGEVVERPSSVVKELVENSIDAGATAITIGIKNGGTTFIRVTDNGKGIEKDDIKTAFISHATSKIQDIDDLESIFSLGFRGEALASIASVSQVEMITKTCDEDEGYKITINGGEIESFQSYGCKEGTSICVSNLFYNIPARRKFLKKPSTESGYISDIVNKMALGHPEISFKFINNDTVILHTSGNNDLKEVVFNIYGKDTYKKMLDIESSFEDYSISGLIGKPELSRANRNYENLFINGRFIKSDIVSNAVEDAYKTRLLVGKFPVYVINMSIPPSSVDVNVHPTKLEVRFDDEDKIYDFVYKSVIDILKEQVLIPEVSIIKEDKNTEIPIFDEFKKEEYSQNSIFEDIKSNYIQESKKEHLKDKNLFSSSINPLKSDEDIFFKGSINNNQEKPKSKIDMLLNKNNNSLKLNEAKDEYKSYNKAPKDIYEDYSEKNIYKPFFDNYKIIGQVFNTYWIIEQEGSIFYIDQHAAHERILFEEFLNKFKSQSVVAQKLIVPEILNVSEAEKSILDDNKELLESFGFETELIDRNVIAIKTVPYIFNSPQNPKYFSDILDILSDSDIKNIYDTKILSVATCACKAAVKANDKLSFQEAHSMIKKLLTLENPFTCPHGRPTIIEIKQYELEKLFKRIQN
ncbi:MAG: DNA mismatch repair endonuclease MutL [Tyzzerella sp.]|uniref:DNA mismatch repair protein MutL n=1 Tax=Candidatus Fimicola merdigallinarum TaxID=2840819 RepID=A0A9D9DTY3_9FIRM|nr:DNA mismatch repair endonuclease MutL [Candidatus Fimicola merdigallinarum]